MGNRKLETAALLLAPAVIGVIAFVCFSPAIDAEFLDFDDNSLLLGNPEWRGFGRENLEWMFTAFRLGQYQPITWLSYAFDHLLWGLDPKGYHLTNVVLHSVNSVLLFFFVLQCQELLLEPGRRPPWRLRSATAALATLLFAIHPMRVESVAWVTERRDVLSLLFLLVAMLSFNAYYRRRLENEPGRWRFYIPAWLAFSISLLCKTIGMTVPVALFLFTYYVEHRRNVAGTERPSAAGKLLMLAPFFVCAVFMAAVAFAGQQSVEVGPLSQGGMRTLEQHSLWQRLTHASYGFLYYPVRTLVPYRLSALYSMPIPYNPNTPKFLLAVAATGFLLFAMWRHRNRYPGVVLAFITYGLIISPVVGLTHVGLQVVADRYSYHSLVPFVPLVAIALLEWDRRGRPSPFGRLSGSLVWCIALLVVVVLGWSTASYASKWRDDLTLWNWCVDAQPGWGPYYQRASVYLKKGELEHALADARRVVEHAPGHFNGWLMQTGILVMRGERREALRLANRLVFLDDNTGVGFKERGKIKYALGIYDGAAKDFSEALQRDPELAEAAVLLGQSDLHLGRYEQAIRNLERGVRLGAERRRVLDLLARAKFELGDLEGALADVDEALESGADHPNVFLLKGQILLAMGDPVAGREALGDALDRAPREWPARAHVESLLKTPRD